jgi:hypothetical protein
MKTTPVRLFSRVVVIGAFSVASFALPLGAQVVDPDPELFDGTRTKAKETPKEEQKETVDDWEDANLIVYDSKEEGSAEGGQGRAGYKNPGMDIGSPNGTGVGVPLPIPMGGGGIGVGAPSIPQLSIPTDPNAPATPGGPGMEGMEGQPMAGTPGAPEGAKPGGKPGSVTIGDPTKQIKTVAVNVPPSADPNLVPGEQTDKPKGEDTTNIPKAASGAQSGDRGGGVEKGDGMPSDL